MKVEKLFLDRHIDANLQSTFSLQWLTLNVVSKGKLFVKYLQYTVHGGRHLAHEAMN